MAHVWRVQISLNPPEGKAKRTYWTIAFTNAVIFFIVWLMNATSSVSAWTALQTRMDVTLAGRSKHHLLQPPLAFPAGNLGRNPTAGADSWDYHVILSSIRVPLAASSGDDLSDVRSIDLVFDATDSGAIYLTDLELLRIIDMIKQTQTQSEGTAPECVTALETAYGAPSQAAFGSAVFHERLKASDDLEQATLAKYRYFVGDQWERFGEAAWMGPWTEVYSRQPGTKHDIVAELGGLADRGARLSASVILDDVENAEEARAALSAAFDDSAVTEISVYNLGDGGEMSGLLIAGRSRRNGRVDVPGISVGLSIFPSTAKGGASRTTR